MQADGVPLFIEELTKAVQEASELDAASTLAVPDTLQGSLMARLDRLPAAKQVAQIGSVIGREFSHPLLAAAAQMPEPLLAQGLHELVASGLVFRRSTPPDAVYNSSTRSCRMSLTKACFGVDVPRSMQESR